MSEHTPGPWTPVECDGNADDIAIAADDGGYVCYSVATEADALLIAAAPDLLAALKELIDQLEGIGIPDWHGAEGLSLDQARAAINKAEGRGE
jgi:hypothetical protein